MPRAAGRTAGRRASSPDRTRRRGTGIRISDGHRSRADLVHDEPYAHDQNDVLFAASIRNRSDLDADERASLRDSWFARSQACFRASPLPRTHGWGVHCDEQGRIAVYGVETEGYRRLAADPSLTQTRALRSTRA